MTRPARDFVLSRLAWAAVGVFWFLSTRDFHPTAALAVVVTASLVTAFAAATDVNLRVLVPRYWRTRRYARYAGLLLVTLAAATASALAVIRGAYVKLHGPDADPYGLYKHFAIDLFGTAGHVAAAAAVARAWRRAAGHGGPGPVDADCAGRRSLGPSDR